MNFHTLRFFRNGRGHFLFGFVIALLWSLYSPSQPNAAQRIRFAPLTQSQKRGPIRASELAWRPLKGTQAQTWIIWGWNQQGYMVTAFFISTRFLFVSRFGVQLTIRKPDGTVHHDVKEYTMNHVRASQKSLSFQVAQKHMWKGGLDTGRVRVRLGRWACDLTYRRTLPPIRALGGPMRLRSRIFEGLQFGPRLQLKGHLWIDGKKIVFRGLGYADYSLQTIVPRRLARRWYAMRAAGPKTTIIASHLWTHSRWKPSSIPTLSIARGKRWIFKGFPRTVRFVATRVRYDAQSKYRLPMRVTYRVKSDDGTRYTVVIQHKVRYVKLDLMSHINPILRFILQKLLSKPFVYRYRSDVRLTIRKKGQPITRERLVGYSEWMFVQ